MSLRVGGQLRCGSGAAHVCFWEIRRAARHLSPDSEEATDARLTEGCW